MANVIGKKFNKQDLLRTTRSITSEIKSGTHITQGRQFLNEQKPNHQLYRMSSQTSKAHLDAVGAVESHAIKTLEAEIKRLVERPETQIDDSHSSKQFENTMIESIHLQVKGRKQMDRLLESVAESDINQTSNLASLTQ